MGLHYIFGVPLNFCVHYILNPRWDTQFICIPHLIYLHPYLFYLHFYMYLHLSAFICTSNLFAFLPQNPKQNKVGKSLTRLPPYQTVHALLRHTAYPYVVMIIMRMHSRRFASFGDEKGCNILCPFLLPF